MSGLGETEPGRQESLSTAEPSFAMSAVGGIFLGVLGVAILLIFPDSDNRWALIVVPVVGMLAGVLGTYVAAEPYEELKVNYDKLINDATARVRPFAREGGDNFGSEAKRELSRRLAEEGTRLAREAAELGSDGLKIAEAADILRREADLLAK